MSNINNNLGIYNNTDMDDSTEFNLNSHMYQGIEFNNYGKIYETNSKKRHHFLEKSSSDEWGSIVEAFCGNDSVCNRKKNNFDKNGSNTDKKTDQLNKDLQKFVTEYNTYASSSINNLDPEPSTNNMNETLNNMKEGFTCKKKENFENKQHTINGVIETSKLKMTSMYFHYFVYFIIAVTLLAFTFNIMVNPDANVMNAIFVMGALLLVFFISRKFGV